MLSQTQAAAAAAAATAAQAAATAAAAAVAAPAALPAPVETRAKSITKLFDTLTKKPYMGDAGAPLQAFRHEVRCSGNYRCYHRVWMLFSNSCHLCWYVYLVECVELDVSFLCRLLAPDLVKSRKSYAC